MASEKKYSFWPALLIVCLAFGAPLWIGTLEIRIARNAMVETSAMQYLEAIAESETVYHQAHQSFAQSLEDLGALPAANKDYAFTYRQPTADTYSVTAEPREPGKHGKRYFYLDQSGVIRYEVLHPATSSSAIAPVKKEATK